MASTQTVCEPGSQLSLSEHLSTFLYVASEILARSQRGEPHEAAIVRALAYVEKCPLIPLIIARHPRDKTGLLFSV